MEREKITSVCSIENVLESWYEHQLQVMITCWYKLGLQQQTHIGFEKNIAAMTKLGPKYMITDFSKTKGMHHPSQDAFFEGYVFPQIKSMNFEHKIIVLPTNAFTKFSLKNFIEMANGFGCNFILKNTIEEARTFIEACHSSHFSICDDNNSPPLEAQP